MLQMRWLAYMQRQLNRQNAAECGEAKAKQKQSVRACHSGKSLPAVTSNSCEKAQNGFTGSPLVWKHTT